MTYPELDASTLTRNKQFYWGLDLTGTLQGAGGVGGLVRIHDLVAAKELSPGYDGNGNVTSLSDRTTGSLLAAFEYDAFGNTIRATGSHANSNPFRFSTKYTDQESGLIYYGRRFYDAKVGRFVGRDPIEEEGGLNLYGFVVNNAVNRWDYLGMRFRGPSGNKAASDSKGGLWAFLSGLFGEDGGSEGGRSYYDFGDGSGVTTRSGGVVRDGSEGVGIYFEDDTVNTGGIAAQQARNLYNDIRNDALSRNRPGEAPSEGHSISSDVETRYIEARENVRAFFLENPDGIYDMSRSDFEAIMSRQARYIQGRNLSLLSPIDLAEFMITADTIFRNIPANNQFGPFVDLVNKQFRIEGGPASVASGGDVNYFAQGMILAAVGVHPDSSNFAISSAVIAWNAGQAIGEGGANLDQSSRVIPWAQQGYDYYYKNITNNSR